jgi:hypothetical protein
MDIIWKWGLDDTKTQAECMKEIDSNGKFKCRTGYRLDDEHNECYKKWQVYHEGGTRSGNKAMAAGLDKYGNMLKSGWTDWYPYGTSKTLYIPDDGGIVVKCFAGHASYDRSYKRLTDIKDPSKSKATFYCTNSKGGNLGDAQTSLKTFKTKGHHYITGVKWEGE